MTDSNTLPTIPDGWQIVHSGELEAPGFAAGPDDTNFAFWYPGVVDWAKSLDLVKRIDDTDWLVLSVPLHETVQEQIAANTAPDHPYFIIKRVGPQPGDVIDKEDLEVGQRVMVDGYSNLNRYHNEEGKVVDLDLNHHGSQVKIDFEPRRVWMDTTIENRRENDPATFKAV